MNLNTNLVFLVITKVFVKVGGKNIITYSNDTNKSSLLVKVKH